MEFEAGKMYAIVGKVGSGKSAFLTAVIGQMSFRAGTIKLNGSVAYLPQVPFLLNDTVQENIVFGLPFDRRRYLECLIKCRLTEDIKMLPGGDQTEIGERGVNLSGGQKQRVSLARALYANSDIYLIDDTLSALDSQVANSIFTEVIIGEFKKKGKTVILVTHTLSILDEMDKVLLLDKGEIVLQGEYAAIRNDPLYDEYTKNNTEDEDKDKAKVEAKDDQKAHQFEKVEGVKYDFEEEMQYLEDFIKEKTKMEKTQKLGVLMKKEEKQAGRVTMRVYSQYIKAFNPWLFFIGFSFYFIAVGLRNLSDYWLGFWAQDKWNWTLDQYRYVYIGFVVIITLTALIRSVLIAKGM